MINEEIMEALIELQDTGYRDFQSKLIPTVDKSFFIGVRTPVLRRLAKEFSKREDIDDFMRSLPHSCFDENQLHAFIISEMKVFDRCIEYLEVFLPFVDNWATCDQMSPRCFKKHREELVAYIRKWIASDDIYTVRFAIGMLMEHYLDENFSEEYPVMVSRVCADEYYISMMAAWYFATALAKQYSSVIGYLEKKALDPVTHNRTIRKAVESRRLTPEKKEYLRSLIVRNDCI